MRGGREKGDGKEERQKGEGEDEERGSKVKGGLEERVEAKPSEPTWSSFSKFSQVIKVAS